MRGDPCVLGRLLTGGEGLAGCQSRPLRCGGPVDISSAVCRQMQPGILLLRPWCGTVERVSVAVLLALRAVPGGGAPSVVG